MYVYMYVCMYVCSSRFKCVLKSPATVLMCRSVHDILLTLQSRHMHRAKHDFICSFDSGFFMYMCMYVCMYIYICMYICM